MKISRNAPCPCGSGKKYKQCHLGQPMPGEEGSTEEHAEHRAESKKTAIVLGLVGVVAAIGIGIWQNDVLTGLVVIAAWALGSAAYMSFRNPPPPNANQGDPAALNFGRPADRK